MVDALGTTLYTYDGVGHLLSETGPWTGVSVTNTYSNRLRLTSSVNAPSSSAWTQNCYYDAARRLTNVTSAAGPFLYWYRSGLPSPEPVKILLGNTAYITNTYDNVARLLSTTLNSSQGSPLNLHQYRYNLAGQRTGQTNTAGDYRSYAYDNSGQLVSAKGYESNGTVRLQEQFGYAYDAAGNLTNRTNNALLQTFAVNSANELLTAAPSGALTVAGGTVPSATNVTVSGSATGTAALYHDSSWALPNASLPNGSATYTATAQDAQGRQGTATLTVNLPASVSYTYDANGSLTNDGNRSFAYDDENQLVSVWVPYVWRTDFAYDAKMRLRQRVEYTWNGSAWATNGVTLYVYDGNLVVQEQDQNHTPKVSYTRGRDLSADASAQGAGGIGGLLARTDNSGATHAYYHADGNGNVTCLIDTNQAVAAAYLYDPYGKILNQSGPLAEANLYRFSTKEFHPNSGLSYYLYRFYDPSLQRWLNRDPLGDAAFKRPEKLNHPPQVVDRNLYWFVANNPTRYWDYLGLDSPGCDLPNPLNPPHWECMSQKKKDCFLRCCANHDFCFFVFKCTWGSWLLNVLNWLGGPIQTDCVQCNNQVAACFAACAVGAGPSRGPRWFCPNGPNRGNSYDDYSSIPADCWKNGNKPSNPYGPEPPLPPQPGPPNIDFPFDGVFR